MFSIDTKLEDFLYVFGKNKRPIDFKRIKWIKKGKSGCINKKLLIHFFMNIYNIKREDVLSDFISFINSRVIAGETPVKLNNKPDLGYSPKELEGFF